MKKLHVLLAEGFEEIEALTPVDFMRRSDVACDLVSTEDDLVVKGAHQVEVKADMKLADWNAEESLGVVIPGGLPGATNLRDNEKVREVVKKADEEGLLIASICAGPIVLEESGVINGRKVTSYPGFGEQLPSGEYVEERVVVDGNMITARGPAVATDFAITIMDYLEGKEKAEELKESILYKIHE